MRYTATVAYAALLSPISPIYRYCVPFTGPGPAAMSSQSLFVAPEMLYVPRFPPAGVIGKICAGFPESLCVHRTLTFIRLAAMPDASVIDAFAMVPVVMPEEKLGVVAKQNEPNIN